MVCFKPMTVWKQTKADLDIPPRDYYALKKVSFHEIPGREKIEIPCGHCLGCRLDHASMWATRITLEAKNWKKCCFVTLSYNTKNLPLKEIHKDYQGFETHKIVKCGKETKEITPEEYERRTLNKKDLADFMKRLRFHEKGIEEWENPRTGKIEKPIRFFACGEYGPNGGRPHYHMAIFNWVPDDLKIYKKYTDKNEKIITLFQSEKLQRIWGNGFVVIEELNFNTASYIARYVQKKAGISSQKREYTGEIKAEERIDERNGQPYTYYIQKVKPQKSFREPEFINMSRAVGIGKLYWIENKEKIKRNKGVLLKVENKVKLKPIPRYFQKLWEQENWEEYIQFKYENTKNGQRTKAEIISRISLPDGTTDELKYEFYLSQQFKILKDKAKYLKRGNFI